MEWLWRQWSAAANVDGTNGSTMTAADGRTYRYRTTGSDYSGPSGSYTVNERQYADNNSDTLADVAMYYWVNDLRPLWPTSKKMYRRTHQTLHSGST